MVLTSPHKLHPHQKSGTDLTSCARVLTHGALTGQGEGASWENIPSSVSHQQTGTEQRQNLHTRRCSLRPHTTSTRSQARQLHRQPVHFWVLSQHGRGGDGCGCWCCCADKATCRCRARGKSRRSAHIHTTVSATSPCSAQSVCVCVCVYHQHHDTSVFTMLACRRVCAICYTASASSASCFFGVTVHDVAAWPPHLLSHVTVVSGALNSEPLVTLTPCLSCGCDDRAFRGAGQEVGRSCHILKFKGKTIMLDCGVHPAKKGLDSLP